MRDLIARHRATGRIVWSIGYGPWFVALAIVQARPFAAVKLVTGRSDR